MSSLSKLTNTSTFRNIGIGDGIYVLNGDASTGGTAPDSLGDFVRTNTALSVVTNSTLYNSIGFHPTTANNNFRVSGAGVSVNSVTYGNGRFLVVGDPNIPGSGEGMLTSTDGITWTSVSSGTTALLRVVSSANSTFAYGGNSGKVGTSSDGLSWVASTVGGGTVAAVTHNGQWNYHASGGACYRWNGVTFLTVTTQSPIGSSSVITYGNGIWVTPHYGAPGVSISRDAISYNGMSSALSATYKIQAVSYANNRTIITSGNFYSKLSHTTNPLSVNWSVSTLTTNTVSGEFNKCGIAYGAGVYVTVNRVSNCGVMYSGDLFNWTVPTDAESGFVQSSLRAYLTNKVLYGDKFLLVSESGYMATSTNGISWSGGLGIGGTTSTITTAHYGGGIYVYGGWGGVLATSTDAITWTTRTSGTTNTISSITYGNGLYVLTESSGGIHTSTDAITWSSVTTASLLSDSRVVYGNGIFVSDGGKTSTNGTTWSNINSQTWNAASTGPNHLVYDSANSLFIGTALGGLVYSKNGSDWTTGPNIAPAANATAITYVNGLYIYCGTNGTLATSTDAIAWTARTTGITTTLSSVGYYEGLYTAALSTGSSVITSTDLVTWTVRNFGGTTSSISSFTYGDGRYVYVGFGNIRSSTYDTRSEFAVSLTPQLNIIVPTGWPVVPIGTYLQYYIKNVNTQTSNLPVGSMLFDYNSSYTLNTSPEYSKAAQTVLSQSEFPDLYARLGTFLTGTWITRTGITGINVFALTYANTLFVAAGSAGAIRTSTDGITWTARTSNTISTINTLTYGGGGLYVYGAAGGGIGTSTDGITWTARTSGTTSTIQTLTYGSIYVCAGNGGMLRTSTDAITWTTGTSGTTSTINALVYGSIYVCAGNGGMLRTSTDAITWTAVTSGTTSTINELLYAGGLYVYGGNGGVLATSTDAITWTTRTSGTPLAILVLTYGNGTYFYAGGSGQLATSTNAITWSSMVANTTSNIWGLAYGNGTYVYVGEGVTPAAVATTTDLVTRGTSLYNISTEFIVPTIRINGYSGNQVYIKAKP
jgi:hypothetical protein